MGAVSSTSSREVKMRAKESAYNPEVDLEELEKPPAPAPSLAGQPSLQKGGLRERGLREPHFLSAAFPAAHPQDLGAAPGEGPPNLPSGLRSLLGRIPIRMEHGIFQRCTRAEGQPGPNDNILQSRREPLLLLS